MDLAMFEQRYSFEFHADGRVQWATAAGPHWSDDFYLPFQDSTCEIMMQIQAISTIKHTTTVIACRDFRVHCQSWDHDQHLWE